jgi:hypothetical protein
MIDVLNRRWPACVRQSSRRLDPITRRVLLDVDCAAVPCSRLRPLLIWPIDQEFWRLGHPLSPRTGLLISREQWPFGLPLEERK